MFKRHLAAAALAPALLLAAAPGAQALVINGDFESGDTGFLTDFTNGGGLGQYQVAANAAAVNGAFADLPDNTSGAGLYLVANGTGDTTSVVWGQDVTVTPGATYELSFFLADVFGAPDPVLDVVIEGVTLDSGLTVATTAVWESFGGYQFIAGDDEAAIRLVNSSAEFGDNDFGLDDIALRLVSGPPGGGGPGGPGGGAEVPVPAAAPLLLAGLAGLGAAARRRRRKARG